MPKPVRHRELVVIAVRKPQKPVQGENPWRRDDSEWHVTDYDETDVDLRAQLRSNRETHRGRNGL